MTLTLTPEQERRLNEMLRSGAYQNAQEILDRALEMLEAEEDWLTGNRAEISAAIEEGAAQAERGELIDGDEVRARMAAAKKAWLTEHRAS